MSKHLQSIIDKHNQLASIQVTFLDIEKYSLRRTSNQVAIINAFTSCLTKTLKEIGQEYLDFTQNNDFNFKTDIIILPTGDGAAVNFTFEGLNNIHIRFAETFLKNQFTHNQLTPICEKFEANGWCNCHNKFNVRIGIAEGKAIVYKDINGNYNVAGNPINMAARLLSEANRNQICLTETAYKQIIDLSENPNYSDEFEEITDVSFKHDLEMNIYVLKSDKEYINNQPATKHIKNAKLKALGERIKKATSNDIDFDSPNAGQVMGEKLFEMTAALGEIFKLAGNETIDPKTDASQPIIKLPMNKKKTRRSK